MECCFDTMSTSERYAVNLYLKTLPTEEAAAEALRSTEPSELCRLGRKRLCTKFRTARLYYANVVRGMVTTDNSAYNSTIATALAEFFRSYSPDSGTEEIHITADYPVCNSVADLEGIEFIQRYLEAIKLENDFCALFPTQSVERLLHCYHPNTKELVFNIFEQVLTSAVGCAIVEKNITELHITAEEAVALAERLSGLTQDKLLCEMNKAVQKISKELELTSSLLQKYIDTALPAVSKKIAADLAEGKAGRAFIVTG